jgi:phenylacetate-CoA ligase
MFGARKICAFAKDSPPFWHFSPTEDLAYASIYHLSDKFLPSYIDLLRKFNPALIEGYPSALAIVARYAVERNLLLPPAKAVFTVSESFSDIDREMMEKAWRCRVFDRYTSVEGCMFVSQCEFGRYHISPEAGIIEIVDTDGRPVKPGMPGHVVCTGLRNLLQPLIRYKIGDIACWSTEQECPCGRKMPILERIEGRFEDLCYTPDGRRIGGWNVLFKAIPFIREAQVVQETLREFTVYIVPADGFSQETIKLIQQDVYSYVGKVRVSVKSVSSIPRSASGKFRPVVCKLSVAEKERLVAAQSN